MAVSYTNRKGLTYILYRGQTKTGKPGKWTVELSLRRLL